MQRQHQFGQRNPNQTHGNGYHHGSRGGYGGGGHRGEKDDYHRGGQYSERKGKFGGGGYSKDHSSYQSGNRAYEKEGFGGNRHRDDRGFGGRDGGSKFGGANRGGGGNFASKPCKSLVAMSMTPQQASEAKVQIATNQYRLSIKNAPPVFQYPISLEPETFDVSSDAAAGFGANTSFVVSSSDIEKVVQRNARKIQGLIGHYFHSGMNFWTTQQLDETHVLDVQLLGKPYKLVINHKGELPITPISDSTAVRQRSDCQVYSQILNIIMNQAMQSIEGMVCFGRRPRFFDHTKPIHVKDLNMQIWQGYKSSAYMYENDCVLILDSCNRFMSTKTCLNIIDEIYDSVMGDCEDAGRDMTARDKQRFQALVSQELVDKSIVTCYGKRQTYRVAKIDFDDGPCNSWFMMSDGSKVSVAKYFLKEYKLKITNKRQPMIYVKAGKDRYLMIPSEFCLVDGVPDSIRGNSKAMRSLLNEVRYNPEQKMKQINTMVNKLFEAGQAKLAEWGISIEAEPLRLESRRLAQPELIHHEGQDQLFCNERLLK